MVINRGLDKVIAEALSQLSSPREVSQARSEMAESTQKRASRQYCHRGTYVSP